MRNLKTEPNRSGSYDARACYKNLWDEIWVWAVIDDFKAVHDAVDRDLTERGYSKNERVKFLEDNGRRIYNLVNQNSEREKDDWPNGKTNLFRLNKKILEVL